MTQLKRKCKKDNNFSNINQSYGNQRNETIFIQAQDMAKIENLAEA